MCSLPFAAYGTAWFLLLSGIRGVQEHGSAASDAARLRELTKIPRGVWSAFWPPRAPGWANSPARPPGRCWLVGSLAAVGFGAILLV